MWFKRLMAILRQRCPVCLEGKVFHSLLGMNSHCPQCGVKFDRETGYFLNSMFIAYTLGFLILIPSAIWLYLQNASILVFTVAIVVESLVLWPIIFRYSRVLWMHADQIMDPRQPGSPADAAQAEQQPGQQPGQ